jgi:hypothetical protein
MHHLIVHGDPGIRKGAIIEHDGRRLHCFDVTRQGDYHGPEEVQLWCTVGSEDELETYHKRQYVSHWLDVESVDADAVSVEKRGGSLAV